MKPRCLRAIASRALLRPAAGVVLILICALAVLARGEGQNPFGLPLAAEEAENFLRTARVIGRQPLSSGVTHPERFTLTDGTRTADAVWKTVDEHELGMKRMQNGSWQFDFRDSWKSEVAAYELGKLLHLGLVPPTVEREVDGRTGSLQIWVEGVMTEKERQEHGLKPEGPGQIRRWSEQIHGVRLFHQLTYNADFQNIANILVDPDFGIYLIDSSRAFRIQKNLLAPDDLVRFSRTTLGHLRTLDRPLVEKRLGRWLDGMQIDGLLERRARVLTLVRVRLVERGPGKVLFY